MKILDRIKKIPQEIKKRKKVALVIILLLAGLGIWWSRSNANEEVTYTFAKVERKDLVHTLEVTGFVDAKQKARIRFLAGGKLVYLGAQEGDAVKKWQTIATIDQATLQKQLEKDLNLYLTERWDWENTQDSIQDKSLNTSEVRTVEKEQFALDNSVLDVEIRDIAIQNTTLTAPFDGILTESPSTTSGVQLLSSDYFEIVDPTSMVFRAAVDEADIASISLDKVSTITLDSYQDEEIVSQISYISYTSTETSSGTSFVVELPLSNDQFSQQLRIGMNGDANIELERKEDVLVIPVIATSERDGKVYVSVKVNEEEVAEREISVGLETDSELEVVSGLSESDEIVIPE